MMPHNERTAWIDDGDGSKPSAFAHPTEVTFVAPAGLDIGKRWRVRFHPTGPLGGQVGEKALTDCIQTEAQYAARQR